MLRTYINDVLKNFYPYHGDLSTTHRKCTGATLEMTGDLE